MSWRSQTSICGPRHARLGTGQTPWESHSFDCNEWRGREQQSHSGLLMTGDFEDEDWSATKEAYPKSDMSEHLFRWLRLFGAIGLFGTAILIGAG
jgi:hypothetical protein